MPLQKLCRGILILTLGLFGLLGQAEEPARPPREASKPPAQKIRFDGGFDLVGLNYSEVVPAPLKSTESGPLPGVSLAFLTQAPDDKWFVGANIGMLFGTSKFDGTTQPPNPVTVIDTSSHFVFEGELRAGILLLRPAPVATLTAYTGLGYHFWRRDLRDYAEDYAWFYFPVGIRFETPLANHFGLAIDLAMRFSFAGNIRFYLSDLQQGYADADSTLGSAPGFRIRVPVTYDFNAKYRLTCTPSFDYFGIGEGDPVVLVKNGVATAESAHEPASNTFIFGASVQFGMRL